MSSTQPGTFEFVNRPYGDDGQKRPGVEATCCKCGKKEWHAAKSPGAGGPIFKKKGWELGRQGSSNDTCPACVAVKKPKARPKLKTVKPVPEHISQSTRQLAGSIRRDGYMGSSVLDAGGWVNEGVAMADAATDRLLAMAGEAETIAAQLAKLKATLA